MAEMRIQGFKGILKSQYRKELELSNPAYFRSAKNIVLGHDGSVSVHGGHTVRVTRSSSSPFHKIFYTMALGPTTRYVLWNQHNGDLELWGVDYLGNWSVNTVFSNVAVPEQQDLVMGVRLVDWLPTKVVYMITGDVTSWHKFDNSGITDISFPPEVNATFGKPTDICVHKSTLFIAAGNYVIPSQTLLPENLDVGSSLLINDGGTGPITKLISQDGVLYAHQCDNITEILGNNFIGPLSDVSVLSKNTGVGAISPEACTAFKGVQYFMGPGGYYAFNGDRPKLLSANLLLNNCRKTSNS